MSRVASLAEIEAVRNSVLDVEIVVADARHELETAADRLAAAVHQRDEFTTRLLERIPSVTHA